MLKGRYRLDHELHASPRSTVYAGVDQKSGRVAIKVLEGTSDASVLRNSYLANAVGHPSAVNVLDTGSTGDGSVFLVMELLEAASMPELLREHAGHLPVRLACDIADQGLDLLASAHAQGIAHGEIALHKLFFTSTERLKLLGFGKPANEQVVADDVRALSKVIAQLLCGVPVESLQTSVTASAIKPRLPARIADVFERGLTLDAAQHWKSAHAMRAALQLACKAELGRPIDSSLQPLAARPPVRGRGRGLWLAGAAALVFGLYVSREVTELGQELAPAVEAETDITTALQPPQAKAQADEAAPADAPQIDRQAVPKHAAQTDDTPPEAPTTREAAPTPNVPRKPNRAELRTSLPRKPGVPTNIAPLNQLCAQLSSARRDRQLSDHEAQLYRARCTKR